MLEREKIPEHERDALKARGFRAVRLVFNEADGQWHVTRRHRSLRNAWHSYAYSPAVHDVRQTVLEL